MVDRLARSGGSLAQEAIQAALRKQAENRARIDQAAQDIAGSVAGGAHRTGAAAEGPGTFVEALREGAAEIAKTVQSADRLPEAMVEGRATDFHEIAAQIKQADLSFKFALEVRNKLIDAYREVMRMSV